jgi:hypothetical protein
MKPKIKQRGAETMKKRPIAEKIIVSFHKKIITTIVSRFRKGFEKIWRMPLGAQKE